MMNRRRFLRGLFAAPAIVAAHNLMPVRGIIMDWGSPFTFTASENYVALGYAITRKAIDDALYKNFLIPFDVQITEYFGYTEFAA